MFSENLIVITVIPFFYSLFLTNNSIDCTRHLTRVSIQFPSGRMYISYIHFCTSTRFSELYLFKYILLPKWNFFTKNFLLGHIFLCFIMFGHPEAFFCWAQIILDFVQIFVSRLNFRVFRWPQKTWYSMGSLFLLREEEQAGFKLF